MGCKLSIARTLKRSIWGIVSIYTSLIASGLTYAQDKPIVKIEAYGDPFGQAELAPKKQARVYAYRSASSTSNQPINLYLNGRSHASLLKGGYSEFCLAPGKLQVQTANNDAGQLHVGKSNPGFALDSVAGQVVFLKIQETTGFGARIESLSEIQALPELKRSRQQIHTISRAPEVQDCEAELAQPTAAPAAKPAPERPTPQREYALQADALFEFGKAVLKAEGFNAIEALIQQVQKEYSSIDKIRVIGYTDAIGPVALNKMLSADRANTVADRLYRRGLRPKSGIETEGRWSLELAKLGCKNAPTPENKICHAPNRRVVIVIFGARR